jgi:transcriptional regulator with XRE-family HTH domain
VSTDFQQARISLGARLHELRAEAGLTGRQLAQRLGWPQSKISKLENGKQTPAATELTAWADAVGKPDVAAELTGRLRGLETRYRSWKRQLAAGHRVRQEVSVTEEGRSELVRAFEPSIIPGMFQTAEYARHVLTNSTALQQTATDVEDGVRARLKRQASLYEPGHLFRFVVWEAAFHVLYCPANVMLEQLDRLNGLIGLDTVELGILPFGASLKVVPKHGFWIFDERLVIAESVNAEMWLDDPADIELYAKVWESFHSAAVFNRQARRLIARAQAALETP